MELNDRVCWEYRHYLNTKSFTMIIKYGNFQRLVQHTPRYKGPQLAAVKFDGNKTVSKIPLTELQLL